MSSGEVARVEKRIIEYLCPGTSIEDVNSFIMKVKSAEQKASEQNKSSVASNVVIIKYNCKSCGNKNQNAFEEDPRHGQVTCKDCGTVVRDHKIHDGEWKRKFEGEVNPSFHGPAPDPRFSGGHNMRTSIGGGADMMRGNSQAAKDLRSLRWAQNYVEMNLSNMGADKKRTREGYKDQMKREAFTAIDNTVVNLQLHDTVKDRAQAMFASYRDMLEQVQRLQVVEAACLIAAYREMMQQGVDRFVSNTRKRGFRVSDHAEPYTMSERREHNSKRVKRDVDLFKSLHPFACPGCQTAFSSKKDLRMHKRRCSKVPKKATKSKLPAKKVFK